MNTSVDVVHGSSVLYNRPPLIQPDVFIHLSGTHYGNPCTTALTKEDLSKNIVLFGATGTGKTNAINTILKQLKGGMTKNDTMIIFDTKGDYCERFFSDGDIVLGSSRKYMDTSVRWNIYDEILADGTDERLVKLNINELTRGLFARFESQTQPFFVNAAREIFGAFLLTTIREGLERRKFAAQYQNNKALVEFFRRATMEKYRALAESSIDLNSIRLYLGNELNDQSMGILSELMIMINDTFVSVFAEDGNFSVRRFTRERGAKTLFIEYDLSIGQTLSPLYSVLIDLALKESLGQQEEMATGNVYLVLDEFRLLPHLSHIEDAVNFGRSLGVRVIAGLQSVSQMLDAYGESKGQSVLSGFSSMIGFRPNDYITADHYITNFGKNVVYECFTKGGIPIPQRVEGHTVEEWDVASLQIREAIVKLSQYPPFRYRFDPFK